MPVSTVYNPKYRRIFLLILALLLLYSFVLIFSHIKDLLVVAIISLVITYVFKPGVEILERIGISRTFAIITLFALAGEVIFLAFRFFIPIIISDLGSLSAYLKEFDLSEVYINVATWVNDRTPGLATLLSLDPDKAELLVERTRSAVADFLKQSFAIAAGAANIIILGTVVPFLSFFLLKDGRNYTKKMIAKVPNRFFEMTLSLVNRLDVQLGSYIRSIIVESLIIWLLTWPALALLGLKFSLLLGLINGLLNMIPFFGPIIAYIPIGLVVLVTYTPVGWGLIWMVLILLSIQIIDNAVLKPVLISRAVQVHPAVVLMGVLVGGRLAGAIGMFIAVPVFSLIQVIVVDFYEHLRKYKIL